MANCTICNSHAYYVGLNSCECSNPKCRAYTPQEVSPGQATSQKIATRIRNLPLTNTGARQVLYRMDPPHYGAEYVVSSAIMAPYSGPETLLFASDSEGKVVDYSDLDGSSRGHLDNDQAVRDAGYEIRANTENEALPP